MMHLGLAFQVLQAVLRTISFNVDEDEASAVHESSRNKETQMQNHGNVKKIDNKRPE